MRSLIRMRKVSDLREGDPVLVADEMGARMIRITVIERPAQGTDEVWLFLNDGTRIETNDSETVAMAA